MECAADAAVGRPGMGFPRSLRVRDVERADRVSAKFALGDSTRVAMAWNRSDRDWFVAPGGLLDREEKRENI